ncbi:CHAT domain-containing protein [Sarocladium implicatum]|nr:CHAT domain-containing protein [Sarocladium implicatum]
MSVPSSELRKMSISPPYWGIHTSLYGSLPTTAVQDLERAIWLKIAGRSKEAQGIFENELAPYAAVPVVTIEHADFELEAGKWGRAWRILDSRLAQLREAREDLETAEHRLMALTCAMLGTRHRGDVTSSAREIERTQSWLSEVPVTDYTDIQSSCVRRYVIANLFTRLYSGYRNPEAEHIPLHNRTDASGEKLPWGGLQVLRQWLMQEGKFNEANALFRVELNRTPPEGRSAVCEEFLEDIASIPSNHGRDSIEATVRLQWATTHLLLQAPAKAVEEFDKSSALFQKFCDDFGIQDRANTPHMQAVEYERLACIDDPIGRLERTQQLASHMEAIDGFKTGMCLSAAADLTMAYYKATAMDVFKVAYFDVQKRLEMYDQYVSEDICDLVHHHVDLISVTISSLVDRQKALEWVDAFFKEYQHFDAPGVRALLCRSKASLLRSLRRLEEATEVDEEACRLEASGISVGKWMHLRRGHVAPMPKSANGSAEAENSGSKTQPQNEDDEEDEDEPFFWKWKDAIGDESKTQEMAIQLILEWLEDDIASGNPALEEFESITNIDLQQLIFPPDGAIGETAEKRYNCLCTWLSDPPKHQRNRRLFCLVMLRHGRQMYFAALRQWDGRLSELLHLVELEECLPRAIRESFPGNKGTWLGQVALTYMAPLDTCAHFRSADAGERLSRAEAYNNLAIEEYRRTNDIVRVALHQRSGAHICMLNIIRLRQLAAKSEGMDENDLSLSGESVTRVSELCVQGISQAEEADEIFSQSELHASTSTGLEGITHRQNITAFNASAHTVRTAIELLLASPDQASDGPVTDIWRWVQKYKARSLARTIGVRMSDPPELVSKIMSSPDAAKGYEEMGAIKSRIEAAEGLAKFNLRRQLDSHMAAMKKEHDLIRQVLDLREAQPFDVPDVARIEAQCGTSVVLADWFHLPPYATGGADRILLFTVRGQSKPTMDVLTTRLEDVIAWQKTYLAPDTFDVRPEEKLDTMEAREAFDKMLSGLVEPLDRHTKPGELVVLCPSSYLHRLPLHALSVGRYAALIHRNPIVYTHSQSLLRSCFAATEQTRSLPAPIDARFISGIAESESQYLQAGRDSIVALARRFGTDPMIDRTASKESFLKVAGRSRLLHLHTHCNWNSTDPLDHEIELPMPNTPPEGKRPVERITAREFFDVQVSPGTHVNMIACQGGVMDVQLGDEVLGLVPAIMCSGASSTISTLWSISDLHGVRFENGFFGSFLKQSAAKKRKQGAAGTDSASGTGDSRILNLAKAMQVAAKEMDEFTATPLYKWAGYVLHGCWQFPLVEEDVEALRNAVKSSSIGKPAA